MLIVHLDSQDSFRRARDVHLGLMAVVHHVFQGRRALSRMEHKGGLVQFSTSAQNVFLASPALVPCRPQVESRWSSFGQRAVSSAPSWAQHCCCCCGVRWRHSWSIRSRQSSDLEAAWSVQGSAFGVIRRVHDDIATILSGKHPVTEVWPSSH